MYNGLKIHIWGRTQSYCGTQGESLKCSICIRSLMIVWVNPKDAFSLLTSSCKSQTWRWQAWIRKPRPPTVFNLGRKCNASHSSKCLSYALQKVVWQKLDVLLYNVLNMDIFLHKCISSFQKAFINPPEPCGVRLWWMDALFWVSNRWFLCTAIIKLRSIRVYIHITLIVFVWKKKVIYT